MGSSTSRSKTWSAEWRRLCATLVLAAAPAVTTAQDAPDSGIADAVLRLAGTAAGNALPVGGRLYGGTVERSLIVDPDGGNPDFTGNDFVTFLHSTGRFGPRLRCRDAGGTGGVHPHT